MFRAVVGPVIVLTTRPAPEVPLPRMCHMPMMLQDGPSKRRKKSAGKWMPQILPYPTSPRSGLLPLVGVSTYSIMSRPLVMSRSKGRFAWATLHSLSQSM